MVEIQDGGDVKERLGKIDKDSLVFIDVYYKECCGACQQVVVGLVSCGACQQVLDFKDDLSL
jgi:hypothetical protein